MKRILVGSVSLIYGFWILIWACPAQAATDPLDSSNLPTIDTNVADYPGNIWITDTMQKVRQDAGSPGTVHWGTFYGTQNEFVDFQVHLHDTGSGTPNVTVTASDFVNLKSGTKIAASSTNIIVYREAYINVSPTVSNNASSTFYQVTGHYPDVLIPAKDPYWGQTTNAWPFNVASNQNQSAWIDVLIPSNAPAGYYVGSVTVKIGSTDLATMPIIIAVWQWPASQGGQMPSATSLTAQVGNWTYNGLCTQLYSADYVTANCGRYPGAGGSNDSANTLIWLDASLLMKDHRYSMGGLQNIFPQSGSFATWDTYVAPLMNGACLLHGGSGTICPLLSGSKQTTKTIDFLDPASAGIWSNWQSHFNSNDWGSTLHDNLVDEPHSVSDFQSLVANAAIRHGFINPGIPELVTNDIWWGQFSQSAADAFSTAVCGNATCILNSIDILVPTIYYFDYQGQTAQTASLYQNWQAGSTDGIPRQWWMYQACTSAGTCTDGVPGPTPEGLGSGNVWNYPNFNVDGKPAANRAMQWLSALHGNTGELYYAADVCNTPSYHPDCAPSGQKWDPWNGIYYSGGWGDGTLVYAGGVAPGTVNYMGAGVMTPIILPSVRLKNIRDGMQDYEYLNALKKAGQGAFALQQIGSWITNSYTFETTGSGLQAARQNLGTALHQLTYPMGSAAPPSLSSLHPSVITAGDSSFALTVNGANLESGCTAYWQGLVLTTGFVSVSSATAIVPASFFVSVGTVPVQIINPDGGTSNILSFSVIPPPQTPNLSGWPAFISIDGTLNLPSQLGMTYQWTFTPETVTSASAVRANGTSSGSVASTLTQAPALSLTSLSLSPGQYTVQVIVINAAAKPSAPAQATITLVAASNDLSAVRVYPNPFRSARGDSQMTFDQMPAGSTVKIFTVSARLVKTLSAPAGIVSWPLTNESGDKVASGIYLYLITDGQGNKARGKFAVIR